MVLSRPRDEKVSKDRKMRGLCGVAQKTLISENYRNAVALVDISDLTVRTSLAWKEISGEDRFAYRFVGRAGYMWEDALLKVGGYFANVRIPSDKGANM